MALQKVMVNVLLFASAREAAGVSSIAINVGTEEQADTSMLR